MLIYGRKSKVVPGPALDGIDCPNCGNKSFNSFGLQEYFHLYHIPTLPTKKQVGIECTNCKATLVGKEVPEAITTQIKPEVFTAARAVPLYAGLLALVIVIGIVVFMGQQRSAETASYLANPATNDIYTIRVDDIFTGVDSTYPYGSMRLVSIDGDIYQFQISSSAYNKSEGVRKDISNGKASEASYYSEGLMEFTRDEIAALKESGSISNIDRK
jgi:DNA-directed RNA polymerase subunit RPC12/RpoP